MESPTSDRRIFVQVLIVRPTSSLLLVVHTDRNRGNSRPSDLLRPYSSYDYRGLPLSPAEKSFFEVYEGHELLLPPWASTFPWSLSPLLLFSDHSLFRTLLQVCRAAVREARVWEREEPSATGRCWEITFRVSRSQPSGGWHAEAEWSVSAVWSTRKLAACWRSFLRTWSAMPWHTPSTPDARLWLPWTLCMPWSDRDVLYTVSAVRGRLAKKSIKKWCSWTPPLSLSFVILELALWWGLRSSYGACTLTWAFVALVIHRYRLRFQGVWLVRVTTSSPFPFLPCYSCLAFEVLWVLCSSEVALVSVK